MSRQRSLTDLVSARTLEKIQDNFSVATGISCVICDEKGKPITKVSNPSSLWQRAAQNKEVQQQSHKTLLQNFEKCAKTGQIQIVNRYLDCYSFIVPIYIEGRISAFSIGGLTRYGNPSKNLCVEESIRLGIDIDTFLEMYWALPILNEEKLHACANLFKLIASTISTIAKEGTEAKEKVKDVTELNQLLEQEIIKSSDQLHKSEERYKKLFNTINDGVYFSDKNGICTEINQTGANLLGYQPHELINTNLKDIYVNPEDREKFVHELYKEGHIERFHAHIRLKNGSTAHFETNATVIKDTHGNIIGVQGIFRDINHRQHSTLKHDSAKTTVKNTPNHQITLKQT